MGETETNAKILLETYFSSIEVKHQKVYQPTKYFRI